MLYFDTRELGSSAVQVHGDLAADDPVWADGDARPVDAVHVEGRLSAAGEDRFYFTGRLSGEAESECRRCLSSVTAGVDEETDFLVVPTGDETADDPDVLTYDAGLGKLDLRPAVREAWLLAVPAFVLCRDDCRGLCPRCGKDLNAGACECSPATDARWNALQNARDQFDS